MEKNNSYKNTVHVVFKSHLDIGFTDYARRVVNQYIEDYIPRALDLIEELQNCEIGFTWTTGSWLIYEYLKRTSGSVRKRMEQAVGKGVIRWHALPFTMHSELVSPELFRAGLRISKELDERFGVKTISGKFTDIPGHTQAILPLLREFGVKFLHIGINPACTPASLPPIFRWRSLDGSEVLVNYESGYGHITECEEAKVVLWFSHQQDNERPPDLVSLENLYLTLRIEYPKSKIMASDLDRFARQILPYAENFPIIEQEIGDTWIHGVASDPLKVSRYRALCRLLAGWTENRNNISSVELEEMERHLLLVPEHTWGMDLKRYLPDYLHYKKEDFISARREDRIPVAMQQEGMEKYMCPRFFSTGRSNFLTERSYHVFENSWKEQRDYIQQSISFVKNPQMLKQIEEALLEVEPVWPSVADFSSFPFTKQFSFGSWKMKFDSTHGALSMLSCEQFQYDLCKPGGAIGLYMYEVYSDREYRDFYARYLVQTVDHCEWSFPDYSKPGLEDLKELKYKCFLPEVTEGLEKYDGDNLDISVTGRMPDEAVNMYGAPKEIMTCYSFNRNSEEFSVTIHWRGKDANRIPESSWISFDLNLESGAPCLLNKMGTMVSPYNVVLNGNRSLHALDSGMECTTKGVENTPLRIILKSRDAPVVSIGRPRILEFDQSQPDCSEGIFFNLHNNLWGTNFPMWYSHDGLFKFSFVLKV